MSKKSSGLIKFRTNEFRVNKVQSKQSSELTKFQTFVLRGFTPR